MFVNLFQRPELNREYEFQREVCHSLSLKATLFISSTLLLDDKIVSMCRYDQENYGDEPAIWLTPLENMPDTMVWLLSEAQKEKCVRESLSRFQRSFGFLPRSCGNYMLDASLIKYLKKYDPEITGIVGGCFEEGVKVFHGCNNSWYLFSEGGSWNPWYPSKSHSLRPAKNEDDWSGIIAVPHLSRDLLMAYENRDDVFASHPANSQRGLINEGLQHNYDYNLCDLTHLQQGYNDGFSYYQIHVGSSWLTRHHNIIDPESISRQLYKELLVYVKQLCDNCDAESLTLSEFVSEYKKIRPIRDCMVGAGKDIIMGSGKKAFWILNSSYRVLIDMFQGGSIGDLRPYIGEFPCSTGTDATDPRFYYMNSYPYIIQSQLRTGLKNHFKDGSRTTAFLIHNQETRDLCHYPASVYDFKRNDTEVELTILSEKIEFSDGLSFNLKTHFSFCSCGCIKITREIVSMKGTESTDHTVAIKEYVKGCYGFTEYPEDMKGIKLLADERAVGEYHYSDTTILGKKSVGVIIPQIQTIVEFEAITPAVSLTVSDGSLFSPFYTLTVQYNIQENKEVVTCLKLKKM